MSATGKTDARGFTLIEMLVVLAVLGLVSGVAFPAVERAVAQQRFRLAAGEVEATLRGQRASAIAQGIRLGVASPALDGAMTVDLPAAGLDFYPDGSSSGGQVTLSDGRAEVRFVIDAATGEIRRVR